MLPLIASRTQSPLSDDAPVRTSDGWDWDPSVRSLLAFPLVLDTMASHMRWTEDLGDAFVDRVLTFLETRGFIPNLRERIVTKAFVTPDHFEHQLLAHLGNAFGVEPRLLQTAWMRPHNRSEDVRNLYLVGASTQPGAGTPSVMMSAKMTARLVAADHGHGLNPAAVPVDALPAGG